MGKLIFHRKNILPDGDIVEMKISQVLETQDKLHGLNYSLAYIRKGERIVGYDNAEGKGDHRHYRGKEFPYTFKNIETLAEDFYKDIKRVGG
ncbi:MAG: DUF6516 family protein [Pseudomonadota bacterium]